MANVDSMVLAQFLFYHLSGSKLSLEVPAESLKMICTRTAGYYLKDGVFTADVLVDWIVSDYGFKRHEVNILIAKLMPPAAEIGIKIKVGAGGGDDTVPYGGDQPTAPPGFIAALDEVSGQEAAGGVGLADELVLLKSPPGEAAEQKDRALIFHILAAEKQWENLFSDYAFRGLFPKNKAVAKILEKRFNLTDAENIFFAHAPKTNSQKTIAAWIVSTNAKALAYEFADFAARKNAPSNREGLTTALKNFRDEAPVLNAKVQGMINRAQKAKAPTSPILERARERLQEAQQKIKQHCQRLKIAAPRIG